MKTKGMGGTVGKKYERWIHYHAAKTYRTLPYPVRRWIDFEDLLQGGRLVLLRARETYKKKIYQRGTHATFDTYFTACLILHYKQIGIRFSSPKRNWRQEVDWSEEDDSGGTSWEEWCDGKLHDPDGGIRSVEIRMDLINVSEVNSQTGEIVGAIFKILDDPTVDSSLISRKGIAKMIGVHPTSRAFVEAWNEVKSHVRSALD